MNRRRILLVFARLLAFAAIAETVTIWAFWGSSWTPIERHYLSAYISCSLSVFSPGIIEVRLIWKTGHHRKRELATDEDAVDSEDGTRMELSQSAIESGWRALIESPPQQIPAEILRRGLASLAFEDQSLWKFLLLPELYALAALCCAVRMVPGHWIPSGIDYRVCMAKAAIIPARAAFELVQRLRGADPKNLRWICGNAPERNATHRKTPHLTEHD